jgi:hypothetical protein
VFVTADGRRQLMQKAADKPVFVSHGLSAAFVFFICGLLRLNTPFSTRRDPSLRSG